MPRVGEGAVFRHAQVLSIRILCPMVLGKKTESKSRPNRAQMVKEKDTVESRQSQINLRRNQIETQTGFRLLLLHGACMLPVFFLFL